MKRFVSISVVVDENLERPAVSGLPAEVRERSEADMVGTIRYAWVVPEVVWSCLPRLRSRLQKAVQRLAEVEVLEWCSPIVEDDDLESASLVALAIPSALNRRSHNSDPINIAPCSACGRQTLVIDRSVRASVDVGPNAPGLLTVGAYGVLALSESLLRALQQEGLSPGDELHQLTTSTQESYHLLWPSVELPLVAAPYGWTDQPCPVCRRGTARYGFFPVYPRPSPAPDWARWIKSTLASPIVSNRVFRFLKRYMAQMNPPAKLQGMVHGWFDSDSALAFLPEEFQGTEP